MNTPDVLSRLDTPSAEVYPLWVWFAMVGIGVLILAAAAACLFVCGMTASRRGFVHSLTKPVFSLALLVGIAVPVALAVGVAPLTAVHYEQARATNDSWNRLAAGAGGSWQDGVPAGHRGGPLALSAAPLDAAVNYVCRDHDDRSLRLRTGVGIVRDVGVRVTQHETAVQPLAAANPSWLARLVPEGKGDVRTLHLRYELISATDCFLAEASTEQQS